MYIKGDDAISTITVRLNKEEEKLYKEYAKLKNVPLSTLMKEALQAKDEDEIDLESISEYEKRLKNNEIEFYSLEEVEKMLDVENYKIITRLDYDNIKIWHSLLKAYDECLMKYIIRILDEAIAA